MFVEVNGRRPGGIGLDEFPAGIEVEREPPIREQRLRRQQKNRQRNPQTSPPMPPGYILGDKKHSLYNRRKTATCATEHSFYPIRDFDEM